MCPHGDTGSGGQKSLGAAPGSCEVSPNTGLGKPLQLVRDTDPPAPAIALQFSN